MTTKYQWLSAQEHVLKRLEMYAGSATPIDHETHVLDAVDGKIVRRDAIVQYSAALLKVADEVLVNACDNKVRCPDQKFIKASFAADGVFEVSNDGKTIAVELWPGTKRYIAEILFGEMMSGENFDDEAGRKVGGLNGVGVKISCILALWFEVTCVNLDENQIFYTCQDAAKSLLSLKIDPLREDEQPTVKMGGLSFYRLDAQGLCTKDTIIRKGDTYFRNVGPIVYRQRFENNLAKTHPPELSKPTGKDRVSSTTVRWQVDLARLGMTAPLSADVLAVLRTRVLDLAACAGDKLTVYIDGQRSSIKSLKDYANAMGNPLVGRDLHEASETTRMEVCIVRSDGQNGRVVGFVNGIRCSSGTHVELVWRKLCEAMGELVGKKLKRAVVVKKEQLREHFSLVINATVVNPKFTTQTKEKLDTPIQRLNLHHFTPSSATVRGMERSGVVEILKEAQDAIDAKSVQKSVKSDRSRIQSIPKYEKALKLSCKDPCSLYITEGDSAKALAVAGFSVVGREHNGVFPLRGKLVNVQGMSAKKALEHKEIMHLTQILGLDPGITYTAENALQLPYRHLVIFTDQDTDGAHIMGLILNWMRTFYPTLLGALPDFVHRFATPIIRAKIGGETRTFFSQPEYDQWLGDRKPSFVKYFKGLGTSTTEDAKIYFGNIQKHRFPVLFTGATCKEAIDTFFSSGKTDDRKQILRVADPDDYIRYEKEDITFDAVCRKELVQHGIADNRRSLASSVDGLKPSQRKILHVMLNRPAGECKVAQLSASVAEKTAYHHGERSMVQTMVAMAQPWMGANNIALLKPNGMFGSRHDVRTEHSAERYIFTERHEIASLIFPPNDKAVLEYATDDGKLVEPKHFVPIIPFVLVNGTDGIGTGWRSFCPAYAPSDVISNTRRLIADSAAALQPMTPSYIGFKGTVHFEKNDWIFQGSYVIESATTLRITELPPKMWTTPYIEWLRDHLMGDNVDKCFVQSFEDQSLDSNVNILVRTKPSSAIALANRDIIKDFRLFTRMPVNLLNLFDHTDTLIHYTNVDEIMRHHASIRRNLYAKRLHNQIQVFTHEEQIALNKSRFVREVRAKIINPTTLTVSALESKLRESSYYEDNGGFKYLRDIGLFSLTSDMSAALDAEAKRIASEVDALKKTQPEDIWNIELDALEKGLLAYDDEQRKKRDFKPTSNGKKRAIDKGSSASKKAPRK